MSQKMDIIGIILTQFYFFFQRFTYFVDSFQSILHCNGPREVLDDLNAEGRCKIASLRKQIEKLETLAKETENEKSRLQLFKEVENNRGQLSR